MDKKTKETLIHKLILAVELYSAAGDESNSRTKYRKLHDQARAIIMNDVVQVLSGDKVVEEGPVKCPGILYCEDLDKDFRCNQCCKHRML